jgi:GNAT superfamily N-acetyltransferase/glutathione synthase/RimK-type ligase-like ATP-grasp enzyme
LLAIPIRGDAGAVVGGLWGCTSCQWLHVRFLFVPESRRGRGLGASLIHRAEKEAQRRGCIGAQANTLGLEAAPFYLKLGYAVFGELEDYPPGRSLLYLRKRFDSAAGTGASHDEPLLKRARSLAMKGEDEAAKQAYLDVLALDPTDFWALNEIAALANASGHRSAARSAYAQAVRHHPDNPAGRVNLANLLLEDGDIASARSQYEAALASDPDFPEAHQGLARVLTELEDDSAEIHWQKGFAGHSVVDRPYRGTGAGVKLLLLVAARGGNIPTRHWIDDRHFAVTAIYTEFHDPALPLPPHALIVNAIGDADRCDEALRCAERLLAGVAVPPINSPTRVRATGRVETARRLAGIPDVVAPKTVAFRGSAIPAAEGLGFPLLLRAPGFHTGQHFVYVANRDALATAAAGLPGDELLAIQYLDARGPDGMARKYRAMFIDGAVYPLHLAISADWKVHYFTAAMAENSAYRDEERRFLDDMPGVLGSRAMTALAAIGAALGLDYAGIDFALTPDGSVIVFEANATMVVYPPGPDPIWDYRRRAVADVLAAAGNLLASRAHGVRCHVADRPCPEGVPGFRSVLQSPTRDEH